MGERVVPEIGELRWDPNAPEALFLSESTGATRLALNPHFDDPDQRRVVISWRHANYALMSPPNDEARSGHRLYDRGLSEVLWMARVEDSELAAFATFD